MKTKIISIALCGVILLMSSCATIFTSSRQKITFKSNVDGKVYCNLAEIGTTNKEFKIYRKDIPKLYTIKTDGCPDKQFELPIHTNPAYWVNIPFIFGAVGLLGCFWDVANGNHMKTDKVIEVTVDCKGKK